MAYTSSQVVQAVPTGINSALVLIAAASASATSSLTISNCFSATYNVYYVHAYAMNFSATNTSLLMRYGTSGTPDTAATYFWAWNRVDNAGGTNGGGLGSDTKFNLAGNIGKGALLGDTLNLIISNPFTAENTKHTGQSIGNFDVAPNIAYFFSPFGIKQTTSSYTDLVLFPNTGTVAISYAIYGLVAS